VRTSRVLINLGSGPHHTPGWIEYDRSRLPWLSRSRLIQRLAGFAARVGIKRAESILRWSPEIRVHDVTQGIPHDDGTVDGIYSSHMLEHLEPWAAQNLLAECHRVLRPGGTLRVVVPDLEVIVRAYLDDDRDILPSEAPAGDAFIEALGFPLYAQPSRPGRLDRIARKTLRIEADGHRWMYDAESLLLRLREAGFPDADRVGFQEGRDAEVAQLDSRSAFHIHAEAIKSSYAAKTMSLK
jgi:SAM-dependent methyltransferase